MMWGMISFASFSKLHGLRGGVAELPGWARMVLAIFALPAAALVLLSVLALLVSIAALLLLTVPVYRLLQSVCFSRAPSQDASLETDLADSPGCRQVNVKVID